MDRRALTLLELLIAVAVLVALASLVMPVVFGRLAATASNEAPSQLAASIAEARARAMRTGVPIRVVARTNGEGVVQIIHERWRDLGDAVDAPSEDPWGAPSIRHSNEILEGRIEGYVHLALPSGCSIVSVESLTAPEGISDAGRLASSKSAEDASNGGAAERTIAIVLPDGGVLAVEPVALRTPAGTAYEVSLDQWGFGARVARWQAADEAGPLGDDADEGDAPPLGPEPHEAGDA